MALEDGVERVARANRQPSVLLCDRGVMDGAAYISEDGWKELLKVSRSKTGIMLSAVLTRGCCLGGLSFHGRWLADPSPLLMVVHPRLSVPTMAL